jgi:multiple sugar transport system permease protein
MNINAAEGKKKAQINDIFTKKTNTQKAWAVFLFSIIPVLLLLLFTYTPVLNMFYYSVTNWNGYSGSKEFVGLKNYIQIFTDSEYFKVFPVSLYYLVGSFIQIAIALYFATILTVSKTRGKNFFKGVLFFPYLINGVAIGFIFSYFLRPEGVLNTVLQFVGLGEYITKWLGNVKVINWSLAGVSIWRYMGFNMVIFIGAIQSISSEIYEAAEIDGANRWQQFLYIILPSIKRIVQLNLLLSINGALSVFEIPYVMTNGGNGSKTFVIQTVETAFKLQKVGLASAMAVVLFIIVLIVAAVQRMFFGEKGDNRI